MSRLFEPLAIGPLQLPNRIVIAPMCQYSAQEGNATGWHMIHLGHLALSGAGLLILEATAVSDVGRISPADLGLYCDENESALAGVLKEIRAYSPIPVAIQLAHAGRKGSSRAPWDGGTQIAPDDPQGWIAEAPSAVPHTPGEVAPMALDADGLSRVRGQFVEAAKRAHRLGLDGIELHFAHGYLLHEFLSPIANERADAYGGSLENRMRFPLEVFDAVREAMPASMAVWVRVSATDWVAQGWAVEDAVALGHALKARGCDAIHVSSGGISTKQRIFVGPGYQLGLAERIRQETGLVTIAVGLITEAGQAEQIIASGRADAVALARAMLYNPRWPWHAAAQLGAQVSAPRQYWRSQPHERKKPCERHEIFKDMNFGQR